MGRADPPFHYPSARDQLTPRDHRYGAQAPKFRVSGDRRPKYVALDLAFIDVLKVEIVSQREGVWPSVK